MSRLRSFPALAKAAVVAMLVMTALPGCDEDGKSLPATCADPLPLDDIGNAGFPNVTNPCLTPIGDAVSFVTSGGKSTTTAGTSSGGKGGGTQNAAGQGGADSGAGGA